MDLKSYMMIEGNLSNEFNKLDDYKRMECVWAEWDEGEVAVWIIGNLTGVCAVYKRVTKLVWRNYSNRLFGIYMQ